jgi:hypothetical protein
MHAYSGGQWTDESIEMLIEEKCELARTIEQDLNSAYPLGGFHTYKGIHNRYLQRTQQLGVGFTETAAVALAALDESIVYGYSCGLYGHKFVTTPTLATEFAITEMQTLIAGLETRRDAGQIQIITYRRFLQLFPEAVQSTGIVRSIVR